MSSKECWTMQEIFDLIEFLLSDKCEVNIKTRHKDLQRYDTSWVVEWKPDKELV